MSGKFGRRELMTGLGAMGAFGASRAYAASGAPDLATVARDAFLFTLPLVEIARVRSRVFGLGLKPSKLLIQPGLATPKSREVTTPNNDTVYAFGFVDLTQGPATLTLPAMGERYFSAALMDAYSNNFAVLGTRTTGPDGGRFTLVGPSGAVDGEAIRSPTPWVWLLCRIIVDGPQDLATARALLGQIKLDAAPPGLPATPGVPRTASAVAHLGCASAMLKENPAPLTDLGMLRKIAPLGLGGAFDPAKLTPAQISQIEAGVAQARALISNPRMGMSEMNGWIYQKSDTGQFGQDYAYRARVALMGLAALPEAEAMYLTAVDTTGRARFDGDKNWKLHFPAGQLPPVDAFWSLTMYEPTPEGQLFLTENPINRYAIGDRTPGLKTNADGSLDIWISRADPGGERSANWLPAPAKGEFAMTLRAYLPKPELSGRTYQAPRVSVA
jgi:hypothetical protein